MVQAEILQRIKLNKTIYYVLPNNNSYFQNNRKIEEPTLFISLL